MVHKFAAEPPPSMPSMPPLPRGKSRQTVEIDVHASVGIVRPGDKLVIAVPRMLDDAETEYLQAQLPGVEIVPINASALMVYRP